MCCQCELEESCTQQGVAVALKVEDHLLTGSFDQLMVVQSLAAPVFIPNILGQDPNPKLLSDAAVRVLMCV